MADWKLSPGDWCHVDVLTGDAARAQQFYGDVFDWSFEPFPGVAYVTVKTSVNGIESGIGGVAEAMGLNPPAPSGVVPYILAPDMETTLAAIERAGGQIVIPRTEVPGGGEFAHFRDPDGNLMGLWND